MGITVWVHVHGSINYRVWPLHHFIASSGPDLNNTLSESFSKSG